MLLASRASTPRFTNALYAVKTVVLIPIPIASAITATAVNRALRRIERSPYFTSCSTLCGSVIQPISRIRSLHTCGFPNRSRALRRAASPFMPRSTFHRSRIAR